MAKVINIKDKQPKVENVVSTLEWQAGYQIGLDAWEMMDKAMQESSLKEAHDQVKQVAGFIQSVMNGIYFMAPTTEVADKVIEIAQRQALLHIKEYKKD